MAQIVLELPDELVASLRLEAEKTHTTAEALLARHVAANPPKPSHTPHRTAASFWGAGEGTRHLRFRQGGRCVPPRAAGRMGLSLTGRRVYTDTSSFIHAVEDYGVFPGLKTGFLDLIDSGGLVAVTSELTLLETVVGPRKSGDVAL